MSGVLVLAEGAVAQDLLAAARALSDEGAGAVTAAAIHAEAAGEGFEAHVAQAAVEKLIERVRPVVVLAAHTLRALSYLPAVAARGGHGFASDVVAASYSEQGLAAVRPAYGQALAAELDFPGKETVLLLLRRGAFAPVEPAQKPVRVERLDLDAGPRSERVAVREAAPAGDIASASVLVAVGRGVGAAEHIARFERLARKLGGELAVSGPVVESGWAPGARKVGLSGRTVAPRIYLALGISGAAPHVAGVAGAQTIVAVNTDPDARIFDVADYGAVLDMHELAGELERRL